jgi:hypothetical protein
MCGQIHLGRKAIMKMNKKNATDKPLSTELLSKIDAYRRASLYLCVGMLFLHSNSLLKEPLKMEHVKKRLLGIGPRSVFRLGASEPAGQKIRPDFGVPHSWARILASYSRV